jgi:hypothetical protein
MDKIKLFIETGKKKTFAGAVDWPGWCRSAKDENAALQALIDYAPRYAQISNNNKIEFQLPTTISNFIVTEHHAGNMTTDFGAPAIILNSDREPLDPKEYERLQALLQSCWQELDKAAQRATGKKLQKGPRGGGRDLETILAHVSGSERGYLGSLAWKIHGKGEKDPGEEMARTRKEVLEALEVAVMNGLPEHGPRGGTIWPVRYFIRRVAWHVLDHAWEIEDRII